MSKWVCLFQCYESTKLGIVEAETKYQAKIRFVIKELKEKKKRYGKEFIAMSDLYLFDFKSLKKQIKDLAEGCATYGEIRCYSIEDEFIEEY